LRDTSGAPPGLHRDLPLAPYTTLGVGGAAKYWLAPTSVTAAREACAWAHAQALPLFILGQGSNLVVCDDGFSGLVLHPAFAGISTCGQEDRDTLVVAEAGVDWDGLVAWSVEQALGGLETLSGIPGQVGAAPVQNIGAYGNEVGERIAWVEALDLQRGTMTTLAHDACGFSYRSSHFKGPWAGRYLITRVALRLPPAAPLRPHYAELGATLGAGDHQPEVVREAVLGIRRRKAMLHDPHDPNSRSAGSFFTNPIIDQVTADEILARSQPAPPTLHRTPDGRWKISAAWLIEQAGFHRGHQHGRAGLSGRHCLALINRGEATACEILDLARQIRQAVRDIFAVDLTPEPVWLDQHGAGPMPLDDNPTRGVCDGRIEGQRR